MKKIVYIGLFVALLVSVVAPDQALANKEVTKTAVRVSDSHVLFLMKFDFGFLNREAALSYATNRTTETVSGLTYTLTAGNGSSTTVETAGLLIGDAPIVTNTYYRIPYGKTEDFILLVVANLPKQTGNEYELTVTELPYRSTDVDGAVSQASYPQNQMGNFRLTFSE